MGKTAIFLEGEDHELIQRLANKYRIPKKNLIKLALQYFENANKKDTLSVEILKELFDLHHDLLTLNLMTLEALIALMASNEKFSAGSLAPVFNDLKVIEKKLCEYQQAFRLLHKVLKKVGTDGN